MKSEIHKLCLQVVDEAVVELVDRSLLPGDVVRWVPTNKVNIRISCKKCE